MSIKEHHLTMLNSREDWNDWINSIEDLAVGNGVWKYCDPENVENLTFTASEPPNTAGKDMIQKFHTLQAIYDSKRKKYDKVSERIDLTVCQEFKQHFLGIHDVRGKLIALADSIQPTAKDQKQNVRVEFEKLKKGPSHVSLDKWLSRWPTLVSNAKRYKIENLSEAQICDAFIEASRDINPPFYNYMKAKEAHVDEGQKIVKETKRTLEKISTAFLTALNHIDVGDDTAATVTLTSSESEEASEDEITTVQRAKSMIKEALRDYNQTNSPLSDQNITIGLCIKQFRIMAPPKEKDKRGRAAHATLHGEKPDDGSDPKEDDEQPQPKKHQTEHPSPNSQKCVCGMTHKYADCYYLNPSRAPQGWTPIIQIKSKVISTIKGNRRTRKQIERSFHKLGISLPNFWVNDPSSTKDQGGQHADAPETKSTSSTSRAAHATRSAFSTAKDKYDDCFRLDNCADTHVCNDVTRFTKYTPLHGETEIIQFGDSDTYITGTGTVMVHVDTPSGPSLLQLDNVAHVPGFHWNLINTHSLEQQGLFFNPRTCWMEYEDGSNAFKAIKHGAFRIVEPHIKEILNEPIEQAVQAFAMATKSRTPHVATASMDTWHARLGHIRKETLEHMQTAVEGVALSTNDFERTSQLCPECELGQAHNQISRVPTWRGTYPFEKVHFDLIDMDEAFNADSWVAHFYCDYSGYHVSFNLPHKNQDELVAITKEFLALTNDNWGFTTRYIQSDGEKGLGDTWKELIAARGITFNSSPPDTPDQNPHAERSGGVIVTIARKLRINSNLPHYLWPYIIAHATRLLNRIPIQRKKWLTPFEIVHNRKPNLSYLKIIGSLAYVLIKNKKHRPLRAKLQEKAFMGWLLGLSATNIYKVWIPQLGRVVASRDVKVDEKVFYDPKYDTIPLPIQSGQNLTITINEIDLDEEDSDPMHIMDDTTPIPATILPTPASSSTRAESEPQVGATDNATEPFLPLPSPASLSEQPSIPQSETSESRRRATDVSVLQNLRSTSGRTIKLSKKGQDAVNTLTP